MRTSGFLVAIVVLYFLSIPLSIILGMIAGWFGRIIMTKVTEGMGL